MVVIFVHGWSVTSTDTYGQLPKCLEREAAQRGIELTTGNLFLSEYVSFEDDVTLDDIARGFEAALQQAVVPKLAPGERFACITHSTGGPVVRKWLDQFHGPGELSASRMSHLVMLAPANHGSALAQLGKSRISRIRFLFEGAEPGQRVLDWLEPGSEGQWELNMRALDYRYVENGVFPFVLTGQRIDRQMYDHLNSYTGEPGSDGVVRACAANMNFTHIGFEQKGGELVPKRNLRTPKTAFGILPGRSHSGAKMGILRSVALEQPHPTVEWVTKCLAVTDAASYVQICDELEALTATTQEQERVEEVQTLSGARQYVTDRHSMFMVRVRDDRGRCLQDYDLLLTAGPDYSPDELPAGFFRDRQRNSVSPGHLAYYLDHDRMSGGLSAAAAGQKLGFRIVARPDSGLAHYTKTELRSDAAHIDELLRPNETTLVEVVLNRSVDSTVFRLTSRLEPEEFGREPSGRLLPAA